MLYKPQLKSEISSMLYSLSNNIDEDKCYSIIVIVCYFIEEMVDIYLIILVIYDANYNFVINV